MVKIRRAKINDITRITTIYNYVIEKTTATFDTIPKTAEQMESWFNDHGLKYPIIVAIQNGTVVGWASLSKYSTRCGYQHTAEISIYVSEENQSQGIGTRLMEEIIKKGEKAGLHVILARIVDGNEISLKLHEKHGFFLVGILREVGLKFGKTLDVYLMQKIYE